MNVLALCHSDIQRARALLKASPAAKKKRIGQGEALTQALNEIVRLEQRYGAVNALDVELAAQDAGKLAAHALTKLYQEIVDLKRQGKLERPDRVEIVSDEILPLALHGKLSPAAVKHVGRVAGLELYGLFDHPVRDVEFRQEMAAMLRRHYGVTGPTLAKREIRAERSLLEEQARKRNALVALLCHPELKRSTMIACLKKLAEVGRTEDLAVVQKVAKRNKGADVQAAAAVAQLGIQRACKMNVVLASWEAKPYAGTGGLGNVIPELAKALVKLGHQVTVVVPRHATIKRDNLSPTGKTLSIRDGEDVYLQHDRRDGVDYYFLENDRFFSQNRPGLYGDANGDYHDSAERYDFFGAALPKVLKSIFGDQPPDIIQLNDAHMGPAAAYLKRDEYFADSRRVMAVHNMGVGYQGRFGKEHLDNMGYRDFGVYYLGGPAEFYECINHLKLGMVESDGVIFVGRKYMHETMEEETGEGLHGVVRWLYGRDRVWGNMNGIDTDVWNPATDDLVASTYSIKDLSGKATCKATLQRRFGLKEDPSAPLFGALSRLAEQKGIDDVIAAAEGAMERSPTAQFVICGEGESCYRKDLEALAARFPGRIAFDPVFAKKTEHEILAGSDLFLMPSRFEPCGLPQMYAMRYLTAPVVRAVGGLEESVSQWDPSTGTGTGFKFGGHAGGSIDEAIDRALAWYSAEPAERRALLRNCALADFSWETRSAREQLAFYRKISLGAGD